MSLRFFLRRLLEVIPVADSKRAGGEPWKREFPGLGAKGPLGFDIDIDPSAVESISNEEEELALQSASKQERIIKAVDLYEQKLQDLAGSTHPPPQVVLIPLSSRLVEKCKDPSQKGDRIVYQKRTLDKRLPRSNYPLFDFHNTLKILSFKHNLPCQISLPSTLRFDSDLQDSSTIAWNYAVGVYYKATGNPWKLADLDDKTCFVGISFYEEVSEEESQMRTSMAHVYVKNAESQIIRGKPFKWTGGGYSRETTLDREHAYDILRDVVRLFENQRGSKPTRVVVHKTSRFTQDEIIGFNKAVDHVSFVDYVYIESKSGIRFYHEHSGYPPARGTLIRSNLSRSPAILYTVGFVPALDTYQGSTAPFPLTLHIARMDTDVRTIGKDILSLTKMDWNSTDFCTREPVTTSVSRKVGNILAETRARNIETPPQQYRFYM
jgi:hypothetical protein